MPLIYGSLFFFFFLKCDPCQVIELSISDRTTRKCDPCRVIELSISDRTIRKWFIWWAVLFYLVSRNLNAIHVQADLSCGTWLYWSTNPRCHMYPFFLFCIPDKKRAIIFLGRHLYCVPSSNMAARVQIKNKMSVLFSLQRGKVKTAFLDSLIIFFIINLFLF